MVVSSPEVVWHDLECGSYRADLPLWRELADRAAVEGASARILDVGAGTGRVALDLARAGHRVTALDIDNGLLDALRERAGELSIDTVCADARSYELGREDFDLCLMPMQTVQLLGSSGERVAFLKRARSHLRPGGLLAVAIVTSVEPFDCADGDVGPTPESVLIDDALFVSRPTRVRALAEAVLIERERLIYPTAGDGAEHGSGEPRAVRDVIELRRVDASQLEREAVSVELHREASRTLPPTADHVGGTVVMLRA
jgi:SAM-dependent methyltransferase